MIDNETFPLYYYLLTYVNFFIEDDDDSTGIVDVHLSNVESNFIVGDDANEDEN